MKKKEKEFLEHLPADVDSEASDEKPVEIKYPVERHPEKVKSFNLDKNPEVSGVLEGIKGNILSLIREL